MPARTRALRHRITQRRAPNPRRHRRSRMASWKGVRAACRSTARLNALPRRTARAPAPRGPGCTPPCRIPRPGRARRIARGTAPECARVSVGNREHWPANNHRRSPRSGAPAHRASRVGFPMPVAARRRATRPRSGPGVRSSGSTPPPAARSGDSGGNSSRRADGCGEELTGRRPFEERSSARPGSLVPAPARVHDDGRVGERIHGPRGLAEREGGGLEATHFPVAG